MGQIGELEQRISAALDRIGQGLEGLGRTGNGPSAEELQQQLDDERAANAQLEERLKALRERTSANTVQLEQKVERLQAQLAAAEAQASKQRSLNDRLQHSVEQLRSQNESMVGDPHLVNKAMMAELESLRSARAGDVAEMDAILVEMAPLVGMAAEG
ncbi:MAG: hypothetical protein ACWA47_00355 [Brevirhabdus sp.]